MFQNDTYTIRLSTTLRTLCCSEIRDLYEGKYRPNIAVTIDDYESVAQLPCFLCPPVGMRSIVMNMSVCLSVCLLSARLTRKLQSELYQFLCTCTLHSAVARSFSDGVAIRCVLPVLRMTSHFHAMERMGYSQLVRRHVGLVPQVAVPASWT